MTTRRGRFPRPRRPAALVGGALAALLVLAGCGGIPTSGPVVEGPALTEVDPDYSLDPNGPEAGASPEQILEGFMLAVGAPQSNYQVARSFLTPDLAAKWNPDDDVLVRAGGATVSDAAGSTDAAPRLTYRFDSEASVDSAGRYRETASSSAHAPEFDFARVDGEWRISVAPDGIVLSEVAFARAFVAAPLYFFDASERYLVPDVRWLPLRTSTPQASVAALLAGPDEWLAPAVVSEFPSGVTLGTGGVTTNGGRTTVDLSAQAASASPESLGRMRQQLAATLGVTDLSLTAAGVPLGQGAEVPQPIRNPQPNGAVLVGTGTDFGFASASGVTAIDGISPVLLADGATAAALANDQGSAVYLAGDGSVRLAIKGTSAGRVIDSRPGLLAPTVDPAGFVWTATGGTGGAIEAFTRDGKPVGITVQDLPPDGGITSIAMSRDGTRLAVLVSSSAGARLLVFAIARQNSVPTQLRSPLILPAPSGTPTGVAWVDDQTLVAVAAHADGSGRDVRLIPIGSPSTSLGSIGADGVVVGGPGGQTGIRALAGGRILAASSTGWSDTGIMAKFLGVQQ